MGASEWKYLVPYQPNLNRALQELRQQEFERGVYFRATAFYDPLLADQPEEIQAKILEEIAWSQSRPQPRTIAEVLEQSGEEGTHSILDIERVSVEPDFGTVSPLQERARRMLPGLRSRWRTPCSWA